MHNAIEAVLFDLDGVIVFTDKYHFKSWKMLADKLGWDFTETLNHKLRGIPRMASLQVILDHNGLDLDDPEKEKYAAMKNDFYQSMLREELDHEDLYPGVLDFIDALSQRDIKLALCSSSKNATLVVHALGIQDYFQTIVSGHDIERAKPNPQIFLLGARKLQVDPGQCLVFEDAESGIEAAYAAGMKALGVGDSQSVPNAKQRITRYEDIDVDSLLAIGSLSA